MPPSETAKRPMSQSPSHSLPEHSQEIPPPSGSPLTLSSRKAKIVIWCLAVLIVVGVVVGFTIGFTSGERYAAQEMAMAEAETGTITPSEMSYTIADDIDISFTNPNPGKYNWIAIAEAGSDVNGKVLSDDYYETWTYACGSKEDCFEGVESGEVTFGQGEVAPGHYQAVLLAGDSPPYQVKASSLPFTVYGNEINTDKLSYSLDEDIQVTFENPHSGRYNFVAIASAGSDTNGKFMNDDFDEAWIYACGRTDDCDAGVEAGTVTFTKGTVSPGVYQAYLLGSANPPYHIKASSEPFLVQGPPTEPVTVRPTTSPTQLSRTDRPTVSPTEAAPTAVPTYEPTAEPTKEPTGPNDEYLFPNSDEFGPGVDIAITFNNPKAGKWNWIAIGKPDIAQNNKISDEKSIVDWVYACGSQECEVAKTSGEVGFARETVPPGVYKAFLLIRNQGPPFHVKASSSPFTVNSESS